MAAGAVAPACPADSSSRIGIPPLDRDFHDLTGLGRELRRHDKGHRQRRERPCAPGFFRTGHDVQQLQPVAHVVGINEAGADVLPRPGQRRVERVQVHLPVIEDVTRHHGPLEEVDVVHLVDHARGGIKRADRGVLVFALVDVDEVHGRARRAEMHPVTAQVEVKIRVLRVQHQILARDRQGMLDQRTREAQSLVLTVTGAGGDHVLNPGFGRVGNTDGLQRGQSGLVDRPHIIVAQRFVGTALHARANRTDILGQRCSAQRGAGRTATGATLARGGWSGLQLLCS